MIPLRRMSPPSPKRMSDHDDRYRVAISLAPENVHTLSQYNSRCGFRRQRQCDQLEFDWKLGSAAGVCGHTPWLPLGSGLGGLLVLGLGALPLLLKQ